MMHGNDHVGRHGNTKTYRIAGPERPRARYMITDCTSPSNVDCARTCPEGKAITTLILEPLDVSKSSTFNFDNMASVETACTESAISDSEGFPLSKSVFFDRGTRPSVCFNGEVTRFCFRLAFPWLLPGVKTAPIFRLNVSPASPSQETSASANETELNVSHNSKSFLPHGEQTTCYIPSIFSTDIPI